MFREKSTKGHSFKKGIDQEEAHAKRITNTIQLRKTDRDTQIANRRKVLPTNESTFDESSSRDNNQKYVDEATKKLPIYREILSGNNYEPRDQLAAITAIRQLLSIEVNPPIQAVIDHQLVPLLAKYLTHESEAFQLESSWALTNIASGTTLHTRAVVNEGVIPTFVLLLNSPHVDVCEQAVWALGNISGDSIQYRTLVLEHGALPNILNIIERSQKASLLRNATWTLSNLCRGRPHPDFKLVSPALPILSQLINSNDADVIADACWALSYLSDESDQDSDSNKIEEVMRTGVTPRLVQLLRHESTTIKTPALRTLGNFVTGSHEQTQRVLDCGIADVLLPLLTMKFTNIQKETCWTISNITAGSPEQIEYIKRADLFPTLIKLLESSAYEVVKESAWAISNALSGGNIEQVVYLVGLGVIPPFCNILSNTDTRILRVALDAVESILATGQKIAKETNSDNEYALFIEECGGLDKLDALQQHSSSVIYEKVHKILLQYFDAESAGGNDGPEIAGNQFIMQPGAGSNGSNFNF